jgi:hypothetical protein
MGMKYALLAAGHVPLARATPTCCGQWENVEMCGLFPKNAAVGIVPPYRMMKTSPDAGALDSAGSSVSSLVLAL